MKFRKKPVEIEAVLWDGSPEAYDEIEKWGMEADLTVGKSRNILYISTLEGEMTAQEGDWIIKGVEGEIYPCKPEIFAKTYDQA